MNIFILHKYRSPSYGAIGLVLINPQKALGSLIGMVELDMLVALGSHMFRLFRDASAHINDAP